MARLSWVYEVEPYALADVLFGASSRASIEALPFAPEPCSSSPDSAIIDPRHRASGVSQLTFPMPIPYAVYNMLYLSLSMLYLSRRLASAVEPDQRVTVLDGCNS